MRLYWSPDYVGGDFDTVVKSKAVVDLVRDTVDVMAPTIPAGDWFEGCVTPEYLDALQTGSPRGLAGSSGFDWTPAYRDSVLASTAGVYNAALMGVEVGGNYGAASSGLHHARASHGAGFCAVNGLAVAAKVAFRYGADRVHIVDLDAHCGGGTWDILHGDERISCTDVAVDGFDRYHPDRRDWPLEVVTDPKQYLRTIWGYLPMERFDLVLYNAGMDPWEGSYIGGLRGITEEMLAERDAMVFEWARTFKSPVAFVFAGGYGPDIARLHAGTVMAALNGQEDA